MTTTGQLRERLTFQARAQTAGDGYGNFEGAWQDRFTCAARVLPLKGSETVLSARLTGQQPVVITVRRSAAARQIGADWRAVDARTGVIYALTSPPADMGEGGAFLDMLATSGKAA